ncbi:MAG: dephospho-CoA kinase [Candidatus Nitrotoga sp.]
MKAGSANVTGNTANIHSDEKLVVGLTGGIGSGKSTVAQMFAEYGVAIIDSDLIARELTQAGGSAIAQIRTIFGHTYLDKNGALNRIQMRQRIFTDPAAKLQLEAILHPMIRAQMQEAISARSILSTPSQHAAPYLMLVVPLLFSATGFRELAHYTLMVDCEEDIQIARVINRDGLDEQAIRRIMAAQMPRAEQLKIADHIIQNNSTLMALQILVQQQHRLYLAACQNFSGGDVKK